MQWLCGRDSNFTPGFSHPSTSRRCADALAKCIEISSCISGATMRCESAEASCPHACHIDCQCGPRRAEIAHTFTLSFSLYRVLRLFLSRSASSSSLLPSFLLANEFTALNGGAKSAGPSHRRSCGRRTSALAQARYGGRNDKAR